MNATQAVSNTPAVKVDEKQALLARIAELERTIANRPASGGIKISAKGGVSVYGMGRFPVTLYASQWTALLAKSAEITAFLKANDSKLAHKPESK